METELQNAKAEEQRIEAEIAHLQSEVAFDWVPGGSAAEGVLELRRWQLAQQRIKIKELEADGCTQ